MVNKNDYYEKSNDCVDEFQIYAEPSGAARLDSKYTDIAIIFSLVINQWLVHDVSWQLVYSC